jgi:hypothetical protein
MGLLVPQIEGEGEMIFPAESPEVFLTVEPWGLAHSREYFLVSGGVEMQTRIRQDG